MVNTTTNGFMILSDGWFVIVDGGCMCLRLMQLTMVYISYLSSSPTHALRTPRCAKNREMVWMGLAEFRDLKHCCGRGALTRSTKEPHGNSVTMFRKQQHDYDITPNGSKWAYYFEATGTCNFPVKCLNLAQRLWKPLNWTRTWYFRLQRVPTFFAKLLSDPWPGSCWL